MWQNYRQESLVELFRSTVATVAVFEPPCIQVATGEHSARRLVKHAALFCRMLGAAADNVCWQTLGPWDDPLVCAGH